MSTSLTLTFGGFTVDLVVPSDLTAYSSAAKYSFESRCLPTAPSSEADLALSFIQYISTQPRSSLRDALQTALWSHLHDTILQDGNIHSLAASHTDETSGRALLNRYFGCLVQCDFTVPTPALFTPTQQGPVPSVVAALFGGQGNTRSPLSELRCTVASYGPLVRSLVAKAGSHLTALVAEDDEVSELYPAGFDVAAWVDAADETALPDADLLLSAPYSFPLIGLAQLALFKAVLLAAGARSARDIPRFLKAPSLAGHSQGVVAAVAVALAASCGDKAPSTDDDAWAPFDSAALDALTLLASIGARAQQVWDLAVDCDLAGDAVPADRVAQLEADGTGKPTPMLSLSGPAVSRASLDKVLAQVNAHLPAERRAALALANSTSSFVVSGPRRTLVALLDVLRAAPSKPDADQTRVPFSKRKQGPPAARFLPVSVPCHSPLLADADALVVADMAARGLRTPASALAISVNATTDGSDLAGCVLDGQDDDLVPLLTRLITTAPVNWPELALAGASHLVDFGPGQASGVGALTHRTMTAGSGCRVVLAGCLGLPKSGEMAGLEELFAREVKGIRWGDDWEAQHAPRLVEDADGNVAMSTALSRLHGGRVPPFLVAAMTPTTCDPAFVAAVAAAGFHAEFACGGYHTPAALKTALLELHRLLREQQSSAAASASVGITANIIYANPRAVAWQVPLLASLQADEGLSLTGLSVGGGVPSVDVALGYVARLRDGGLKSLTLKPGSAAGIRQALAVARALAKEDDTTKVVLQWTGGRGGGHHSAEDFHAPLLETYAEVRRCANVVLVAGSGFGEAEGKDVLPYLTGDWSRTLFGRRAAMPVDGVMYGSRVMACRETRTSPGAKRAIAAAAGVEDEKRWEGTYDVKAGGAGGVVSLISEMGEPMHVVATRGARLWAELDGLVFSLERKKRRPVLAANKAWIVERLNADFHKVWFAKKAAGDAAVEVEDMTYAETLHRLVQLMFVEKRAAWIDPSYARFFADFLARCEERFASESDSDDEDGSSDAESDCDFSPSPSAIAMASPSAAVALFLSQHPSAGNTLLYAEDAHHFRALCLRPGQKPVPFVPFLEPESFESFFKKDSLWQAEDLDAVVGEDAGRTFILHGPVAARWTGEVDERVADVLRGFEKGVVHALATAGREVVAAATEAEEEEDIDALSAMTVDVTSMDRPALAALLAGKAAGTWRHAAFACDAVSRGPASTPNPIRSLVLGALETDALQICAREDDGSTELLFSKAGKLQMRLVHRAKPEVGNGSSELDLYLHTWLTGTENSAALHLRFEHVAGAVGLGEVAEGRDERIYALYRQLWLGESDASRTVDTAKPAPAELSTQIFTSSLTLTAAAVRAFNLSIGRRVSSRKASDTPVPLDYAIVAAWPAVSRALLQDPVQGDLLRLVHLSNAFEAGESADGRTREGFRVGDNVRADANVQSVVIEDAGKVVEVVCELRRAGGDGGEVKGPVVVTVRSRFLFRGAFSDFAHTFRRAVETPRRLTLSGSASSSTSASAGLAPPDVEVLLSKPWLRLEKTVARADLAGRTLEFRARTVTRYSAKKAIAATETDGAVYVVDGDSDSATAAAHPVALISSRTGPVKANPVLSYLASAGAALPPSAVQHALPGCSSATAGGDAKNSSTRTSTLTLPQSNAPYSRASRDTNPIHTEPHFARAVAGLPGTIVHGMHVSAAVRAAVEALEGGGAAAPDKVAAWDASFVGMTLPGDRLRVEATHVAMRAGRKVVQVVARRMPRADDEPESAQEGEKVLAATALVAQPPTAVVFTGQGSQEAGMGMELYATSAVARAVWDRADAYFAAQFGVSLLHIVRANPAAATVRFGGRRGRELRANYTTMAYESPVLAADGTPTGRLERRPVFPAVTARSAAFTHRNPHGGLLFATQFAQPALVVAALAAFRDMQSRGVVDPACAFAGHSLGEYAALAAITDFMPFERLLYIVFVRGMTMQVAVERDAAGRSSFGMLAVDPGRVGKAAFTESTLATLVAHITASTGLFLETVNLNVRNSQYVCAGDKRALLLLSRVLDDVKKSAPALFTPSAAPSVMAALVAKHAPAVSPLDAASLALTRGAAATPLPGVDVPFHSSFLEPRMPAFRNVLLANLEPGRIRADKLVGRYIPNVTGRPFDITKEYVEDVAKVTGSERLRAVLDAWTE